MVTENSVVETFVDGLAVRSYGPHDVGGPVGPPRAVPTDSLPLIDSRETKSCEHLSMRPRPVRGQNDNQLDGRRTAWI